MDKREVSILGLSFTNLSMEEVLAAVAGIVQKGDPVYAVTPNVDQLVRMQKEPEMKKIYREAALVLADGKPLLWAGRFLGAPLKQKISGSDLLPRLCDLAAERGFRVFFLGAQEGVAARASEKLKNRYPGLQIAGVYAPPRGFENDENENRKIVAMIKEASPHMLFAAMGAPRQEKWIRRFKSEYGTPFSMGVGASFDFVAGNVRRAPVWMQEAGLEWFWRLMMEPRRLWKRYLVDDPVFFWYLIEQRFGKRF